MCVVSKVSGPGLRGSAPLQTSARFEAPREPSPKMTRMMQHAWALETSMTNRTGCPATGDAGSMCTRALTPFLSACQELAGRKLGRVGGIGMVWIGGRVEGTVDAVTARAVVAVVGRRVVVVARTLVATVVDDDDVVAGAAVAVVVVVPSGAVARPEAVGVEAGVSITAPETAPATSSRAMLARRLRTARPPPADSTNAVSAVRLADLSTFPEFLSRSAPDELVHRDCTPSRRTGSVARPRTRDCGSAY